VWRADSIKIERVYAKVSNNEEGGLKRTENWDAEADIILVGGGSAGVSASIAASRLGKSVILVERYGFLGGTATAAMVGPMATFHTRSGKQVIKGIPEEIVDELVSSGGSLGHIKDTIGVCSTYTPFEPEILKLVLLSAARRAGVNILFHSWVHETLQKNGRIEAIRLYTKGGTVTLKGKVFIDSSGDGDVAAFSGVPFSVGENGVRPQPMTFIFKVGNVKLKETVNYILSHREEFWHETLFDDLANTPVIGVSGFYSFWKEAQAKGEVDIPRDRILFFSGIRPGEVVVNTTRIIQKNPLNPWDLSHAEEEGRKQLSSLLVFFRKYIPGFQDCYLVQAATQVGVRESRRIHGDYTLTAEDVSEGRSFSNGIAKGAYPIDIHDPEGKGIILKNVGGNGSYDIPYPCLIPQKVENLLMAGRCISATHEALGSCRIQATAMAIGQAAGTAAALSLDKKGEVRQVSIPELRNRLTQMGALL